MARERGIRRAYVPEVDAAEAALVAGITVYPVRNLAALAAALDRTRPESDDLAPMPYRES